MKKFIITKKIAKHGNQQIIILPSILKDILRPKTLVRITIDILDTKDSDVIYNSNTKKTSSTSNVNYLSVLESTSENNSESNPNSKTYSKTNLDIIARGAQ